MEGWRGERSIQITVTAEEFAREVLQDGFPTSRLRHRYHLRIAHGINTCRREDKNKIGQKEMLRCDAGPTETSGTSQKVLELEGLSELY